MINKAIFLMFTRAKFTDSIKISFGILLIASVSVVYLTILAITLAALFGSEGGGDCGDCGDGGGSCVLGIFDWGGSSSSSSTTMTTTTNQSLAPVRAKTQRKPLNFLEDILYLW